MLEFLECSNDVFCFVICRSVRVKDKLCSDHRYGLLLLDLNHFLLNLFETAPRAWLVRGLKLEYEHLLVKHL
jgi:hypothetical protein